MQQNKLNHWIAPVACGLALVGSTSLGIAQSVPTLWLATFDSDTSANTGVAGNAAQYTPAPTNAWSSVNAPGGPTTPSGSEYVWVPWQNIGQWGWQEYQMSFNQSTAPNCANWLNVEYDVKIDTANSFTDWSGNYGSTYVACQCWNGPGWVQLPGTTLYSTTTNGGWQHITASLATFPNVLNNLVIDLIGQQCSNNVAYWIDNVKLTAAPVAPPTLGELQPPTAPGLTLIPCTGGQYQRVMVYPNPNNEGTDFGWFGKTAPVSYSFTITHFPVQNDYAANVFWIPNGQMQYGANDTSIDWNCTNSTVLNITANTNNPATNWNVTFSTKTNANAANPNYTWMSFNYPVIPNGTWTITFSQNTNFTIAAPNGFTTNGFITSDVADLVSGNSIGNTALTPFFGIMNRVLSNIGVPCIYGGISIQGVTTPVSDTFSTGSLDTTKWTALTDYAPDVLVLNNDLFGYLSWNTPNDQGFQKLIVASDVEGPYKPLVYSSNWLTVSTAKVVHEAILYKSALHATLEGGETNAAFFALVKPVASKLQILLPGEVAAPGTPTGKTGTPTMEPLYSPFTVTVNAVDNEWNVVTTVSDKIDITSTDTAAALPPDTALVNGTWSISAGFYFDTAGTWTITATDVTSTNIASAVSSPVVTQ